MRLSRVPQPGKDIGIQLPVLTGVSKLSPTF